VYKRTHKTNLTRTGICTQQMHKMYSYVFRHSVGAIIRESSQWLMQCFRNGPLYAAQSHACTRIEVFFKTQEIPPVKSWNVKIKAELEKYLLYCFKISAFYGWFLLCFEENFNTCASVWLLHTTDHFEGTALTTVKTHWWWHPQNAETCRSGFCAFVVYIFQCMWGWFYEHYLWSQDSCKFIYPRYVVCFG